MNKSKGFTIIELIVVIAIIAVLASIVLVNVTSYINKGKDANAKATLSQLQVAGATWAETHGDYTAFTVPANITAGLTAQSYTATFATTATTGLNWCALVTLKASTNTYCVDSTGNKLEKASGTCLAATGTCL